MDEDEDRLWRAPKAKLTDWRSQAQRPWFGLHALVWGSLAGSAVAGVAMVAANYHAQERRRLAWFAGVVALALAGPALAWSSAALLIAVWDYERLRVAAWLGLWLLQPVATWLILGPAHRRQLLARARAGQPLYGPLAVVLVVLCVWLLEAVPGLMLVVMAFNTVGLE